MKKNNLILTAGLIIALSSGLVAAEQKSNPVGNTGFIDGLDKEVSVTTNYVWRGFSQGGSAPAVQGGLTYEHDSGISANLWLSSSASSAAANASNEYDMTVSYVMQRQKIGYEFGLVSYNYPQAGAGSSANELFMGLNVNEVNAYVYLNPDKKDGNNLYIELAIDIDAFNIALGINSNKTAAKKYNQVTGTVALSKDLSLSLSQTDIDGAKHELALSYNIPLK